MADIRGLLSSELGQTKVLALALQMSRVAGKIPQFALDQICVQLFSRSHYDANGNHVLFRPNTNDSDLNVIYHSALAIVEPNQTEGAILNALSSNSKGAKVHPRYVTEYLRKLHTVSPFDTDRFYRNVEDLTRAENRTRFVEAYRADKTRALTRLYYELNCDLMAEPLVQTVRWIRMMLLPYMAISSDRPEIEGFIANRNSIPVGPTGPTYMPILQFAGERNMRLMSDFHRYVSPKVFLENDTKSIEIHDDPYDLTQAGIPPKVMFYNMLKIQIAILMRNLIPSLHIRTVWEDVIPVEIYPSNQTEYILRCTEVGLKYRSFVKLGDKTVTFASDSSFLMEGFVGTAKALGAPSRTLRDLKAGVTTGVEAYFDTTLPEHKAYVSSLTTTQ